MNEIEKQTIIDEVLSALNDNALTIDQLSPVDSLNGNDYFEISGGRKVSYNKLVQLFGSSTKLFEVESVLSALPLIHAVSFDGAESTPDVWRWKLNGYRASVTMLHGNTQRSLDHPAIVEVNGEFWLWKSSSDVTQRIAGEFDLASAGGSTTAKVNSLESDVTTLQKVRTYPIGGFVDTPEDMLYPYGDATIGGQPNTRLKWVGFHNDWYYWFLKEDYVGNGSAENPQYRKGLYNVLVDAQTENYAIGERISLPYATIGILCTGAVYKISNQGYARLSGLTWGYNATTRKLTLSDDEGAGSIEVTLPLASGDEAGLMSATDKQTLAMNTDTIGALPIIHAVPLGEASGVPDVWCWNPNGHRASVTMLHGNTIRSLDHPAIVEVNGEFWLWKSSSDVTQRIAGEFDLESAGGSTTDTSVWIVDPQYAGNVAEGFQSIPVEKRKRGMLVSSILGGKWTLLQSAHTAEDDLSGQQWHNMTKWTFVTTEDVNTTKNYQAIQALQGDIGTIKDATCDIAPLDILHYSDYINLGKQTWNNPSDVYAKMLAGKLAEKNKMLMYNVLLFWKKGDTMIAWQYTAEPEDWENQPMASGVDEEGNLNTEAVNAFLALPGWERVYPTWKLVPKSDAQFAKLDEQFFDINSRLWMKAEAGDVAERFNNIGATDIDEYMTATHPDMIDLGESSDGMLATMRQYIDSVSSDPNRPNDELFAAMKTNVFKWAEVVSSEETLVHYFKFECTRDEFVAADTEEAMRALAIDASPKTTIEGLHTKVLNNELAINEVDANARRLSQYRIFDLRDFQRDRYVGNNICAAINDAMSFFPIRLADALIDFRFAEGDVMLYYNGEGNALARVGNMVPLHSFYDQPEITDSMKQSLLNRLKYTSSNWTEIDIRELGSTAYLQKQLDGIDQYIDEVANPNFNDIMQGLIDREQAVEHIEAESADDLFPNAYNLASDAPELTATSIERAIRAWLNVGGSNTIKALYSLLTHRGIKFRNADTESWEVYVYEGTGPEWAEHLTNPHTAPDAAVIASMLTRIPEAVNIRQLYGKLLTHEETISELTDRIQAVEHINAESTEDVFPGAYNLASDAPEVANATSIERAIRAWYTENGAGLEDYRLYRNVFGGHHGVKFRNADTGAWECYIYEGSEEQWCETLANRGTAPIYTAIASMLTRTPEAVTPPQLYGKLLQHILDWQRAEENFNLFSELIEAMLERIDALEALTANTVEMEVTYDDDTTETFHLVNVPSAVAPQEEEEE